MSCDFCVQTMSCIWDDLAGPAKPNGIQASAKPTGPEIHKYVCNAVL